MNYTSHEIDNSVLEDKIYEEGYYDFGKTIIFYDRSNQMFYGKNYETEEMLISDKLKHVMLLVEEVET